MRPDFLWLASVTRVAAVLAAAFLLVTDAFACSPAIDNRSFDERLAAAPVAFIGTVLSVDGSRTTFAVEHALHPASLDKRYVIDQPQRSTCTNVFEVGQKWLFAGGNTYEPSMRLDVGRSASKWDGETLGRLQRSDDKALELLPEFTRCSSDAQCVRLAYNCSSTSVNAASLSQAKKHVFGARRAARPEAVSCPAADISKSIGIPGVMCHVGRCGGWRLVF